LSKADDIVSRHLAVAEATGDVLPSKRRRSLANYVRATKHLDLDPWQVDLCNRLEKAFWLAQAAKFEFEQVYVDEGFYYESPSGFLIEKEEFEAKTGVGTLAAIHAGPQSRRQKPRNQTLRLHRQNPETKIPK
jgi:hypothetical protein